MGRFISADDIAPGLSNPQSRNRYSYTLNNPLRFTDPTGHCAVSASEKAGTAEDKACQAHAAALAAYGYSILDLATWQSSELLAILEATQALLTAFSWDVNRFKSEMGIGGGGAIDLIRGGNNDTALAETRDPWFGNSSITFYSGAFTNPDGPHWVVVHELAHVWDNAKGGQLSSGMQNRTGSSGFVSRNNDGSCYWGPFCYQAKGTTASGYGGTNAQEDWAESVAASVYPTNNRYSTGGVSNWDKASDYTRRDYVREKYK